MPPVRPNGSQQVTNTFGDSRPFVNDKNQWKQQTLLTRPLPRPLIYAYDTTQKITRVRRASPPRPPSGRHSGRVPKPWRVAARTQVWRLLSVARETHGGGRSQSAQVGYCS